ncbi:MAG: hypothetical protein SFV18_14065 [Bryobacteraceae bacterium]|nr:hypothetical protein [Bryobacteraceae bacterium]
MFVGLRVETKDAGHAQTGDQLCSFELEDDRLAVPRHAFEQPALGALPHQFLAQHASDGLGFGKFRQGR